MQTLRSVLCLTLLVACVGGCRSSAEDEGEAEPTVAVEVARVRSLDLDVQVEAPATVYAREQAGVSSRLTARILRLGAQKGDSVTAGQVLARLEDGDLRAQRNEAVAAVADAQATLRRVSAGTLPAEIERARGQMAAAQATLDEARANYDRRSSLFEQGAIPERDLLASRTALATAEANANVAGAELRLLEGQTGTSDVEIARSRLAQAQSRLALIDAQLEFATIRSPFAGTIIGQFMYPGDMASPDRALFSLADLSVAIARARVPERDATDVRTGEACLLNLADRSGTSYAGEITMVSRAVDAGTRTVEAWCEVANAEAGLRIGAYGKVVISTTTLPDVIAVPVAAVQFDEGLPQGIVMIASPNGIAERREVETGSIQDGWVEISEGLGLDEIVIVQGGYGLPEGAHVVWSGDPE